MAGIWVRIFGMNGPKHSNSDLLESPVLDSGRPGAANTAGCEGNWALKPELSQHGPGS